MRCLFRARAPKLIFKGKKLGDSEMSKGKNNLKISVHENLVYLPLAVISFFFREFGLQTILDQLAPPPKIATSVSHGIEALVCHRCIEPGSKLAFQRWRHHAALEQVIGTSVKRLNNTRVHRILDVLAGIDDDLQQKIRERVVATGLPRVIYLDLTDTWFESGGGSLARNGRRKISRLLEKLNMVEYYDITLRPYPVKGKKKSIDSFQLEITKKENMLRYARRYDGFSLVVGHPILSLSAEEAIEAYRQKDVIEANFRTIKSVLQLRPTFHWTTDKIKSHVSICTLALLVERLIELKLKDASENDNNLPRSAQSLLKELNRVQLNNIGIQDKQYWGRTRENALIRKCLGILGTAHILEQYDAVINVDQNNM